MALSGGKDDGAPMLDLNVTPLIDVMLVLLIMFIITIPVATHSIDIDLPVAAPPTNTPPPVDPIKNKVSVDPSGTITWNGSPIDIVTLRLYLDRTKAMSPEPELHVQPDPQARYNVVDNVLAVVKRSGVSKMGFVGNEQYRAF